MTASHEITTADPHLWIHPQPKHKMTIAYLRGRHLARHKKGVHPRSSAGHRPNDGRIFSALHSCLSGSDVSSLNLGGPHSCCPLVAASSRSSSSGLSRRDIADPTLLYSVHPHLLCDLRLSVSDLQGRYAAFGESFRVHVTVFGVQQSLDYVQIRLCLSDIGLGGFGSGEMRRKKTAVHIALPRHVSTLIAVHGVVLASKALRRAYGWRCVLHRSGDFCPPRDPRLVRQPLQPNNLFPRPGPSPHTRPCMQLSIGTWNVEGLNSERKQHEIGNMLRDNGLHIVAVQESHEHATSVVAVPGFRWFGRPRKGRSKGGVGFLVSLALIPEIEICEDCSHPESVWLKVHGHRGQRDLYIGCVYMPPSPATTEENNYNFLLDDVAGYQGKGRVMVLGDLNARVGSAIAPFDVIGQFGETTCNANGMRLVNFLHASDMYALNGRKLSREPAWTRCRLSRSEQSIIDYMLVDSDVLSADLVLNVSTSDVSDHYLVHCLLPSTAKAHRPSVAPARLRYKISRLRDEMVRAEYMRDLGSQMPAFLRVLQDVQQAHAGDPALTTRLAVLEFEQVLSQSAESVLGRRTAGRRPAVPWWSAELRVLIDERRAAYAAARTAQLSGTALWSGLCDRWKAARTRVKAHVRQQKRHLWQEQMRTCSDRFREGLAKDFWASIRWRTVGKTPPVNANHVTKARASDGHVEYSDVGITRVFADHYHQLGCPELSDVQEFDEGHYHHVTARVAELGVLSFEPEHADDVLDAVPCVAEIDHALKQLACHKAGTDNGLVNELLKHGGPAFTSMFHSLVSVLWESECVPQHWRAGDIVNLFKKGDRADPGNYRGITLLDVVGKFYTMILNTRLMSWMEAHNSLHSCQAGFRRGRSCADHIFNLSEIIQSRIRQGLPTYIFFRDVKKAFDTVWRDGLFYKLWDMGIRGKFWRILRNLYADTQSRVLVNGQQSEYFPIQQGVAQGDPLSPTLYAIFENELLDKVHSGRDMHASLLAGVLALAYADDVVGIAYSASNLRECVIGPCYEHARQYRYRANVPKCAVMLCGPVPDQDRTQPFMWGDQEIPIVDEYTHLGVLVSSDGSQDAHFQRIIKQGNARVAAMKPLLKDAHLTMRIKRLLMLTALRPCLEFASEVLVPNSVQCRALESVQLKAARVVLGCPTLTGSEAVRGDLHLALLSSRRDIAKLKWQHRLQSLPDSRLEKVLYLQAVPRGTRGRKRKLFTQTCDQIWLSLVSFPRESLSMSKSLFVRSLCSTVQERDEASVAVALSTKPRLGLYKSVTEGTGFKEYLLRHTDGHRAAMIRFQFRSGSSMLNHHLPRHHHDRHSRDAEDGPSNCPTCRCNDLVEDVPHALFSCGPHAAMRASFLASLKELVGAPLFAAFIDLCPMERTVALLRDDFMSSCADPSRVHCCVDQYFVDITSNRAQLVE